MADVKTLADLEQRALGNTQSPGTKKTLRVRAINRVAVTKQELQAAIDANPDHPVAQVYAAAITRLRGTKPVGIEAPDLLALVRNQAVQVNISTPTAGMHTMTKSVVPLPVDTSSSGGGSAAPAATTTVAPSAVTNPPTPAPAPVVVPKS